MAIQDNVIIKPVAIMHNISDTWTMSAYHYHDHYEINVSISGGNRFFINDHIFTAEPGDLFTFSSSDLHKNMVPKGMAYERYLIFFDPRMINTLGNDYETLLEIFDNPREDYHNRLHLNTQQLISLRGAMDETIFQSGSDFYENEMYMTIKLAEILLLLDKFYRGGEKSRKPVHSEGFAKIRPVIDHINNHLEASLSLDELSKAFFMNKYYLCERFKKETEFTINQYITMRRLLKAKSLLKEGYSVTEVTSMVGYQNDSHFIRTFKKHIGTTPKQYAKM